MRQNLVALLPLKAHSARIPRKNFRPLAGKPLVWWILGTLLAIEDITQVVINTDARKQLEEIGVEESDRVLIRDRREDLRGDFVSMNRVLEDDVSAVAADTYLMTHTTNPLLSATTLREAIGRFRNETPKIDSLFSVNRFQTRFYREDGSAVNHDPRNLIRTQDLEPWYEENSCLYLFTRTSFDKTGARIGEKPMMFETPPLESVDIDELHQWHMAEALLQMRQRQCLEESQV